MKLSEHFDDYEFWCKGEDQGTCNCGHSLKIDPLLIKKLEELRADIGGYPLYINSGYRCKVHNARVGGAYNSQHTMGTAADIARPEQLHMGEFEWYIKKHNFDGVGIYYGADFIHVDVRDGGTNPNKYLWFG